MTNAASFLIFFNSILISYCHIDVVIEIIGSDGSAVIAPPVIDSIVGSNLMLRCSVEGDEMIYNPDLIWGKGSREIRFKDETELLNLAHDSPEHMYSLQNEANQTYHLRDIIKHFVPLKKNDRGTYFCLSLKYMRAKIVHIRVKELWMRTDHSEYYVYSKQCKDNFRCVSSGLCITSHYMCDGHPDCFDHSDEDWILCGGDPCLGKIHCPDKRCIPTSWCCDKRTDADCVVDVRPSCCPPLPDPYDPVHWYYNNKVSNESRLKEFNRGQGSKFLFITICVITAILAFVLFLFIVSRICGLDTKPVTSRNVSRNRYPHDQVSTFIEFNRCGHSECSLQREFGPNIWCLYRTANINTNSDNNNEVSDPLLNINEIHFRGVSDEPPSYSEVVNMPTNIDKSSLNELFSTPPPPYSHVIDDSTRNTCDNNNDQSSRCDNGDE